MAEVEVRYVEHPTADVAGLVSAVNSMQGQLSNLASEVVSVNSQVDSIQDSFLEFLKDFRRFVEQDLKERRLQEALSDRVSLQQELERRFSRHQMVRRYVTGILQASDISLVRQETISACTEELMVAVPHYWLVPALIALSAWLGDNRALAEKALREAIVRDDEKTSLLFALICRRASRNAAATEWLQRYFSMQDPMQIERKLIVVLDAYANGLFGSDAHGLCAMQLASWIAEMEETVGFREKQVERWEAAISGKIPGDQHADAYPYLSRYAFNWAAANSTLNDSALHGQMHAYLRGVFEQPMSDVTELKQQLDELLNSLITNYDSAELPLREQKRFADLIVETKGDEREATRRFEAERSSFDEASDLTQLLTNAAMNPELVGASPATQKLSMSISRDWLIEAYDNVTLRDRSRAVDRIEFEIEDFKGVTFDGGNEEELCTEAQQHFNAIRDSRLAAVKQSPMDFFLLIAGVAAAVMGFAGSFPWYVGLIGCGLGILKFVLGRRKVKDDIENIRRTFAETIEKAQTIVRAICAETIDLRREIARLESEYDTTMAYMQQIAPEQFVKNGRERRIRIA